MVMQHSKHGNELVVQLTGELDHHCAQNVRETIDAILLDEKIKKLSFDLQGLTFMDSSGIGVLLGRYKLMQRRNGQTMVCHVHNQVDKILQMASIYQVIHRADAVRD